MTCTKSDSKKNDVKKHRKSPNPIPDYFLDYDKYNKYRTFWRRFFALTIDGLIFLPLIMLDSHIQASGITSFSLLFWGIFYSLIWIIYYVLMHSIFGQTIGKMMCRIIVLEKSETKLISPLHAAVRDIATVVWVPINIYVYYQVAFLDIGWNTAKTLPALLLTDNLIYFWICMEFCTMQFNRKRRAIHDFMAGSVVIHKDFLECEVRGIAASLFGAAPFKL